MRPQPADGIPGLETERRLVLLLSPQGVDSSGAPSRLMGLNFKNQFLVVAIMETKHARAPWTIEPASIDRRTGSPVFYYVHDADLKIVATTWSARKTQTALADARLMAAAPEMLEALKKFSIVFQNYARHHALKGDEQKKEQNRAFADIADFLIGEATGGEQ